VGDESRTDSEITAVDGSFESAFYEARNVLVLLDKAGRFFEVNLAFERLVGCTEAELRGRPLSEFWAVDIMGAESGIIEHLDEVGQASVEAEPAHPGSGVPRVTMLIMRRMSVHGSVPTIAIHLVPAAERDRKVEMSSGAIGFELSFDQINVAMIITRIDGSSQVNDALCALVGRAREEIAGMEPGAIFHEEDRPGDYDYGTRAFAGEIDGWTREKRLIRKDGSTVWALETVTLIQDENGEPLHFLSQLIDISDRKRAEVERDRAEARATFLSDGIPVGLIQVSADGVIMSANAPLAAMLGRDPVGVNIVDFMVHEDLGRASEAIERSRGSDDQWRLEFGMIVPDGPNRWIRAHSRCHYDSAGELESITAAWTDVTDEIDARRASERFAELLEEVDDVIAVADPDGLIVHLNRSGRTHRGNRSGAVRLFDLFEAEDALRIRETGLPVALATGTWTGEVTLVDERGGARVVSLSLVAHRDARSKLEYFSAITRDISQLKQAEERLRWRAATDVLTNLPNRGDFYERLGSALARGARTRAAIAVLFVDLDHFKAVNDNWGHEAGDELLIQVARRLTDAIRTGDTVARVGGDEFVVLAEPVGRLADARAVGERIVTAIAEPFRLTATTVTIGASVGLAVSTSDSTSRSLVRAADLASLKAKAEGRSRLVCADPVLGGEPFPTPVTAAVSGIPRAG
jgi:diguanylate cyclase (GGDEF)-like protein/PAS domain S-box-containing protein